MSIEDFFQAFYQDVNFFRKHNISHIKSACLYFTPCDVQGSPVVVFGAAGEVIDGYVSAGAYPCAAQLYEDAQLEPKPLARSTLVRGPKHDF
ncbi:MAG: hypothetical protein ACFCVH_18615 [Alphaproteobacteria bacterium]